MEYPILSQPPPPPYGIVVSPKPDYGAFVSLWLEFLKNCPCGRAEVFCPFDWHVRSRALRGSLRERRRGRQKLAPNFAFCFWQKCLFCSQQARVILHKLMANQDPCYFIQVLEKSSKPNDIWRISKKIGLALFLVILRLWLLRAIGFCFCLLIFDIFYSSQMWPKLHIRWLPVIFIRRGVLEHMLDSHKYFHHLFLLKTCSSKKWTLYLGNPAWALTQPHPLS